MCIAILTRKRFSSFHPSSYNAGVLAQSGSYWYSQDVNGNQYLWTTNGWVPTTATAETDPSIAVVGGTSSTVSDAGGYTTPASTVVGPPTAGDPTMALLEQAYASGDPLAIDAVNTLIETQNNMTEIVLNPGGNPDQPISEDWDQDSTPNSTDYQPNDYDVQDPAAVVSDTDQNWDLDSTPDSTDYDPYDSSVQDPLDVPSDTDY